MKTIVSTFLATAAIAVVSARAQTNVFNSTGNAGVGTTSPAALLHLLKNGGDELVRLEAAAPFIYFKENDQVAPAGRWRLVADGRIFRLDRSTSGEFASYVTDFFISESGRVGIGATAPDASLHVARTAADGVAGGTANSYEVAQFKVHGSGGGKRGLEIGAPAGSVTSPVYLKVHGTSNRFALLNETNTEQLTILSSGNVGIGTTSPTSARLVVASPQAVPGNTIVGEFTKTGGNNTYGSAILRLSRSVDGESSDFELNSGGSGPFRFGTYSDALLVNNQNWTNGPYGAIHFVTNSAVRMTIGGGTLAGNIGIGTTNPTHKLAVNGTIKAKEVIVETTGWADCVFAADYRLAPLSEVEQHIQQNGHLPGVPSAAQVAEQGVSVGEVQKLLLQKIEELTLHQIAQEKRMSHLEAENADLRSQVTRLENAR